MEGEEGVFRLELRLLADVGLLGLPNVGKSTLLANTTAANARVGAYVFTTVEPQLGVVEIGYERLVLVDVPGLVEGSGAGAGLGDEFLRHLQRTKVLIHMIDGDSPTPREDAEHVNAELANFDPEMAQRLQVLVINKVDLLGVQGQVPRLREDLASLGRPLFFISAATGVGVADLMEHVLSIVKSQEIAGGGVDEEGGFRIFQPKQRSRDQVIQQDGGKFMLVGREVPRVVVPWDTSKEELAMILRERLRRTTWRRVLERAGVKPGDMVQVGDVEIEW